MMVGARAFFACILGLGAVLGSATSVTAQIDSRKLPAAKEAAALFAERAKGSEKTGEVPRMTDPAMKKLLDAMLDVSDIVAAKAIPFASLSTVSERMLIGNQVGVSYMLSGTGSADLAKLANEPGAGDKINLNVVKYPDEMGRYLDFTVTMQGAIAEVVQTYMSSAKPADLARPNFQSGLADIRGGATRSVSVELRRLPSSA